METLFPPNANALERTQFISVELLSSTRFNASNSLLFRFKLAGISCSFSTIAEMISSTAPQAPKVCPVMDLVEPTSGLLPKSSIIAFHSELSFATVPVPWALM